MTVMRRGASISKRRLRTAMSTTLRFPSSPHIHGHLSSPRPPSTSPNITPSRVLYTPLYHQNPSFVRTATILRHYQSAWALWVQPLRHGCRWVITAVCRTRSTTRNPCLLRKVGNLGWTERTRRGWVAVRTVSPAPSLLRNPIPTATRATHGTTHLKIMLDLRALPQRRPTSSRL